VNEGNQSRDKRGMKNKTVKSPKLKIQTTTESMEVHHHPKVEKKNLKEYFLEFVMIFLAVTLGFFAEGIREGASDRSKEKEYMLSMVQDLKDDTSSISTTVNQLMNVSKRVDTMLIQLKNGTPDPAVLNRIISSHFWSYAGYSYNNRTVQQLKNSGNFRLIRNEAVADSILMYDNQINTIIIAQWNDLKNTMYAYKDVEARVVAYQQLYKTSSWHYTVDFNDSVLVAGPKKSLVTNDAQLISLYYNRLFIHATLLHLFISNLEDSQATGERLMAFITEQYRL
jgi:hypothetical protein